MFLCFFVYLFAQLSYCNLLRWLWVYKSIAGKCGNSCTSVPVSQKNANVGKGSRHYQGAGGSVLPKTAFYSPSVAVKQENNHMTHMRHMQGYEHSIGMSPAYSPLLQSNFKSPAIGNLFANSPGIGFRHNSDMNSFATPTSKSPFVPSMDSPAVFSLPHPASRASPATHHIQNQNTLSPPSRPPSTQSLLEDLASGASFSLPIPCGGYNPSPAISKRTMWNSPAISNLPSSAAPSMAPGSASPSMSIRSLIDDQYARKQSPILPSPSPSQSPSLDFAVSPFATSPFAHPSAKISSKPRQAGLPPLCLPDSVLSEDENNASAASFSAKPLLISTSASSSGPHASYTPQMTNRPMPSPKHCKVYSPQPLAGLRSPDELFNQAFAALSYFNLPSLSTQIGKIISSIVTKDHSYLILLCEPTARMDGYLTFCIELLHAWLTGSLEEYLGEIHFSASTKKKKVKLTCVSRTGTYINLHEQMVKK